MLGEGGAEGKPQDIGRATLFDLNMPIGRAEFRELRHIDFDLLQGELVHWGEGQGLIEDPTQARVILRRLGDDEIEALRPGLTEPAMARLICSKLIVAPLFRADIDCVCVGNLNVWLGLRLRWPVMLHSRPHQGSVTKTHVDERGYLPFSVFKGLSADGEKGRLRHDEICLVGWLVGSEPDGLSRPGPNRANSGGAR